MQQLSDDDIDTMMGCDKYNDFWPILKSGMLPVFEQRGALWPRCVIAFFQDGVRRTDWIEFKHPREYPDGAAAWAAAPVPSVTHEVVEGPSGEQVALEYRTAEERAAQIAAYLDAADDSDATVPRSDEETDDDDSKARV
jgi:hypothetical protein